MKKSLIISSLCLSLCGVVAASFAALNSSKRNAQIVAAGKTDYAIIINHSTQQTKSNANKYVLTTSGNEFAYHFGNSDYDSDEVAAANAICMLRDNGSGIYFDSPIQTIKSFSITFDNPGSLHVYFSDTKGSFTGEDPYLTSGQVFTPTVNTENVYINIWSNLTTYVESIVINYSCE